MNKNKRRTATGHGFDWVGRVIDGLIGHGRLIFMILFAFAVTSLIAGLAGLAKLETRDTRLLDDSQGESVVVADTTDNRVLTDADRRSDARVEMHYRCTYTEFRAQHEKACEDVAAHVEAATKTRR